MISSEGGGCRDNMHSLILIVVSHVTVYKYNLGCFVSAISVIQ
jgi:hypothetical protein